MARLTTAPASLSLIGAYARNVVKFGAVGIVVFIIGRYLLEAGVSLYKRLNPPPPTPPTMAFGLLPPISFPTQLTSEKPKSYVLQTVGQRLPDYGIKANVYFMPTAQPSLLALDNARQQASALGFVFTPEKVSSDVYRWRKTSPLPGTLETDVVHNTLTMKLDWTASVDLLNEKQILTPDQLNSEAKQLMRNANILSSDLATASASVTYLRAYGGNLQPVNSVSEADFVQLDYFRQTPDGFPALTSERNHGIVRILFSGSRTQGERILGLSSQYYPVLWSEPQTYPLQTAKLAWQSLQAGQGYVTGKITGDTATVRQVYLAYFEPSVPQNYLIPVYVFEGDDGFQALVPALNPRVFSSATK